MKYISYAEHMKKWLHAQEVIKNHNDDLIKEWQSIPWWKFWVKKPSFEEQRSIIMENWGRFGCLQRPHIMEYMDIKL